MESVKCVGALPYKCVGALPYKCVGALPYKCGGAREGAKAHLPVCLHTREVCLHTLPYSRVCSHSGVCLNKRREVPSRIREVRLRIVVFILLLIMCTILFKRSVSAEVSPTYPPLVSDNVTFAALAGKPSDNGALNNEFAKKQPVDPTLTALAALNGSGFIYQTEEDSLTGVPSRTFALSTLDNFTLKQNSGVLQLSSRIEQNIMLNAFRISVGMSFVTPNNMSDGVMDTFGGSSGVDELSNGCRSEDNSYYSTCEPYTTILLHFDSNFSDSSGYGHNVTATGAATAAANKFGGASAYFDGTGDYLNLASTNDLSFGSSNFTIEMWVKGGTNSGVGFGKGLLSQWQTDGEGLGNISNWSHYDSNYNDGYVGVVFDGRYVYFVPYHNGSSYHGDVLRYDTQGAFDNISSWSHYDSGYNDGYEGGVFDGRYIYFVPYSNGSYHGDVLRYDTQGAFNAISSWSHYDSNYNDGYRGGVFDGRYVYFVPNHNGSSYHGDVLRYDTQGAFDAISSWSHYDAGYNDGYYGGVFDGRYVYFVPNSNGSYHGDVLRYDTQGAFNAISSWSHYDAGYNDGYYGGVFDGRYVYFVPYRNGSSTHGDVLRYDTQGAFNAISSWSHYDSNYNDGYRGGVFDGRYVYFVPDYSNGSSYHGDVLRYDTQGAFDNISSWSHYDAGYNAGYFGGVFDGRYIYFVPYSNGSLYGDVLRYDTTGANRSFKLFYNAQDQSGGFAGAPWGVTFQFASGNTTYTLASNNSLNNAAFHHIAIVRNNTTIKLYIDGIEQDSISGFTGSINRSSQDLTIGSYPEAIKGYDGYIDEARVSKGIARYNGDFSSSLPSSPYAATNYDMTLGSVNTNVDIAPTKARLILFEEDVDTITVNTDLMAYVSNNGGENYYEVILSDEGNYQSGRRILTGTANLDTTGTDMKWKITTHNNKTCRLNGWSCTWD